MKKPSTSILRDVGNPQKKTPEGVPQLGQVTRMIRPPGDPAPGEVRWRRRDGEAGGKRGFGKYSRTVVIVWTVTLGALAMAAVVAAVAIWLMPFLASRAQRAEQAREMQRRMAAPIAAPEQKPSLTQEQAETLVKQAMAVREEGEIVASYDCGMVTPAEVLAFLTSMEERDGKISGYEWVPRLDTPRNDIQGVVVKYTTKDGDFRNRLALLVEKEPGLWKVDFPAFARLADPSWSDLNEGRAKSSVVRIYLAKDQYYNGIYQEEGGWRCFGIASPDQPDLMFGYCKVDSPQFKAASLMLQEQNLSRAVVELTRGERAVGRQYEITRIIAQDWAQGEKDFDQELEEKSKAAE